MAANDDEPHVLTVHAPTKACLMAYLELVAANPANMMRYYFIISNRIPAQPYTLFRNRLMINNAVHWRSDYIHNLRRLSGDVPAKIVHTLQQFENKLARGYPFVYEIPMDLPPMVRDQIETAALVNAIEFHGVYRI